MGLSTAATLVTAVLAAGVDALSIPGNIQNLYNSIKAQGQCNNKLASGFYSELPGPNSFSYCGDHLSDDGIIYLQGTAGQLADMDIDCDGVQNGVGSDGRCGSSDDTQSMTAFLDTVKGYKQGVTDLNPFVHPYVVFGNVGSNGANEANFEPQAHGIEPLSIMAVVCKNNMFYGIWGDENGDSEPMIGEAAISLATACFGNSMNGDNGHADNDVLYIAFTGTKAVPGATGAKWDAQSFQEFHDSITTLGNSLVAGIGGSGSSNSSTTSTPTKAPTVSSSAAASTVSSTAAASTVSSSPPTHRPRPSRPAHCS